MSLMFADVLRSITSDIMFTCLLFTLATPKCNKKTIWTILFVIWTIVVITNLKFYKIDDYTNLAKFDIKLYILIFVCSKPLFKDNIMQWFFSITTAMNFYIAIFIMSFIISRHMAYPIYANTFLRILMFLAVIILFKKYLRPIYLQVLKRWNMYLILNIGIFINYLYYIITASDIRKMMLENTMKLSLLTVLMIIIYVFIFYSLKVVLMEANLREEKQKIQSQIEITENEYRLKLKSMEQVKLIKHDMRHHFSVLLLLMKKNQIDEAVKYIKNIDNDLLEGDLSEKNLISEGIISKYKNLCKKSNIYFKSDIGFDEEKLQDKTHLGVILGNVLQNAYEAVLNLDDKHRYISIAGRQVKSNIVIVVKNSINGEISNGYKTTKTGEFHGYGLKSIQTLVEKNNGYVGIEHTDKEFVITIGLTI